MTKGPHLFKVHDVSLEPRLVRLFNPRIFQYRQVPLHGTLHHSVGFLIVRRSQTAHLILGTPGSIGYEMRDLVRKVIGADRTQLLSMSEERALSVQ